MDQPPAAQRDPVRKPAAGPHAGVLRRYVPADEVPLLWLRPSPLFIVLRPLRVLLVLVVAGAAAWVTARVFALPPIASVGLTIIAVAGVLVMVWSYLEWLSRLYVLTGSRVVAVAGVLWQGAADLPLRNVQNMLISRTLGERLMALGTLRIATAGTDHFEASWLMISRPDEVMHAVRQAIDRAQQKSESKSPGFVVVGLVGGVGAGKSEVAKAFAERGYLVLDADRDAKAALDRPEVKDQLVAWWGGQILDANGVVDRKAVARIIFNSPTERLRLEGLIHPLVTANRGAEVAAARARGLPGVVIDAPLLLEAGSDSACDVVVYVDAPREVRAYRVKAGRGWDEQELSRRENAQLPLEEKRCRSDEVITNDAGPEVLRRRVSDLITRIHARFTGPA